jgi:YspA, cpYpsA-related SLOG family
MTRVRVLVTGSRTWVRRHEVVDTLFDLLGEFGDRMVVVHGDCPRGADEMARAWAARMGVQQEAYPADWSTYGRAAGPRRNAEMVATRPDRVLVFIRNSSPGAIGCVELARKAGIPVTEFRHDG